MFDLFSDIFTCRDNILLRTDARTKLLVTLAGIGAIIMSGRMLLPLAFFVLCTGSMVILRIPLRLICVRLAGPLGIALVLIVLKAFATGSLPLFTITVLNRQLTATVDGLAQGLLLGSRVLGSVSLVALLSFVTPAHRLFQALRWFHVPEEWLDIAGLMYRYIFVLLDHTADLAAAQKLRLGFKGIKRSLNTVGILAGATILNSLEQASRVHEAMQLRCYRGAMRFGALPVVARRDKLATILSLLIILAAYLLTEGRIRP